MKNIRKKVMLQIPLKRMHVCVYMRIVPALVLVYVRVKKVIRQLMINREISLARITPLPTTEVAIQLTTDNVLS